MSEKTPAQALAEDDRGIGPVLVKFFLPESRSSLVPVNLPRLARKSDRFYDAGNRGAVIRVGKGDLGRVGRVREGRVDTGELAFDPKEFPLVRAVLPKLDGSDEGWQISSVHSFRKVGDRTTQYVMVLCFELFVSPIPLLRDTISGIEEVASLAWQKCHVWQNPPGASAPITANFTGLQWDAMPRHQLLMPPGGIGIEPIESPAAPPTVAQPQPAAQEPQS